MLLCVLHMSYAGFISGFLDHERRQFEPNFMQHMKRALAGSTGKGMGGGGQSRCLLSSVCHCMLVVNYVIIQAIHQAFLFLPHCLHNTFQQMLGVCGTGFVSISNS